VLDEAQHQTGDQMVNRRWTEDFDRMNRMNRMGKHRTSKVIAGRMPALPVSPGEAGVRLLSSLRPFSSQLFENQLTDSHGKRINANDLMD